GGLRVTRSIGRSVAIAGGEWISAVRPPAAAGAVMAAAMMATDAALDPHSPGKTAAVLALLAVEGTAVYAAALWFIARDRLREFLRELDSFAPVSRLHRRLVAGRA